MSDDEGRRQNPNAIWGGERGGAAKRVSTGASWVEAGIVAGLASLAACAVTAPVATALTVPGANINCSGYLAWAPVYTLLALPISAPLARGLGRWIRAPLRAE